MFLKNKFVPLLISFFVALLVPVYAIHYGWKNFLWLSNIGLFLTIPALWLRSTLVLSMLAISILPVELLWNIDFFYHLLFKAPAIDDLASYMFDAQLPAWLRAISLYHVVLPLVWIFYLRIWGYNPRALRYCLVLIPCIFAISYGVSSPNDNINWVAMASNLGWGISNCTWVAIMTAVFLMLVTVPLHFLLKKILKKAH